MDWAKTLGQEAGMLLIDYEKAYDRIEWNFINMMMEAIGFHNTFIQMVNTYEVCYYMC